MYVGVYFYHTVDPFYKNSLLEIIEIFPQLTFLLELYICSLSSAQYFIELNMWKIIVDWMYITSSKTIKGWERHSVQHSENIFSPSETLVQYYTRPNTWQITVDKMYITSCNYQGRFKCSLATAYISCRTL